jgi:hypothetical protein
MNPVPVSPVGILSKLQQPQLLAHGHGRLGQVAITGQQGQLGALLRLPFELGNSGCHLGTGVVQTTTCRHHQISRTWSASGSAAAILHDHRHRTTQAPAVAYLAVLSAPMLHQRFNFFDHRPFPRKTEPNTENTQPNTNPTQINPFKINIFINFELSVLGLLGFSVLA